MPQENFGEQSKIELQNLEKVKNFRELFNWLKSAKLGKEYEEAYEETTELAKNLIETKNKSSWNSKNFAEDMKNKYPNISDSFIQTLKNCTENYNPPVNIPNKSLWDAD